MGDAGTRRRFSLLGIGLVISYWLIETVADSVFGSEGPVRSRLLPVADPNEIWMRLIIVALILSFAWYAGNTLERRARTERRLRVLEAAVEHTGDAVLITTGDLDPPGPEIIYANAAYRRLTGYTAQELLGQTPRMLQGPSSERKVLDRLRRCLENEQPFVGCLTNYRKDGSPFRTELGISPVYDPTGELTHWISVQRDITDSERAEAALRDSEARKAAIMDAALDCIVTMDHAGMITDFNPAAERTFGYRRTELLGSELAEAIVPPAFRDAHRRGLAHYLATGEGPILDRRIELPGMRADGTEFPAELTVSPIRVGGQPAFTAYLRDVTERKRAEAALRQAEEKYRSIFENAVEGIFQTTVEGRILTANPAAARILGYGSPEELTSSITDVGRQLYADPGARGRITALIGEHGVVNNFEARVHRKDGSLIWVSLDARAWHDSDGKLLGFEGAVQDVTERKRSEEALRESEERYRAVVEQAADGLYLADMQTLHIIETNPAFQEMLGYTAEELHGMEVYEFVNLSREEIASSLQRTLISGHRFVAEREYRRKDGTLINVEVRASGISYGGREVACVVVHNITERKRAERALREVREAERSQIARDLHDSVLQELMDALYSLQITRLKLRGEDIDLPEIDEQIDDLRKATQTLRDAVNNLRRENIQEQSFLLLLRSVVEAARHKAPQTEIDLEVDASFVSEPSGNTGIELLRIIQEALVNARRHSGARHVRVSLSAEEDLTVEVTDDGRGFDPDIDAEATWSRVGISGMRERAFKLGGVLEIHSEPDQGTRVTVRVPVETALATDLGATRRS